MNMILPLALWCERDSFEEPIASRPQPAGQVLYREARRIDPDDHDAIQALRAKVAQLYDTTYWFYDDQTPVHQLYEMENQLARRLANLVVESMDYTRPADTLVLDKKHLRRMVRHVFGSDHVMAWTMVDRVETGNTTIGCSDVTFVDRLGGYRPMPPRGVFYGGLFRHCEAFLVQFEQDILPLFVPGAVLVFNVVREAVAPEDQEYRSKWDSSRSPLLDLVDRGLLQVVRYEKRQYPWEGFSEEPPRLVVTVPGKGPPSDELIRLAGEWAIADATQSCTQSDVWQE